MTLGHPHRFASSLASLLAPMAFYASCADSGAGRQSAQNQSASKPSDVQAKAEVPANAPEDAPYVYSAMGRRDPFRSYLSDLREREQAERDRAPHAETENFDTSQYRLTAIISGHHRPSAMVEDPTGKGHVLRIGDRIGKHLGRITNIDATGLSIVETFYDGSGQSLEVPTTMRLPQSDDLAASTP